MYNICFQLVFNININLILYRQYLLYPNVSQLYYVVCPSRFCPFSVRRASP